MVAELIKNETLSLLQDGQKKKPEDGGMIVDNRRTLNTYSRLMLDSTPMVCAVWNEDGKMIDCNLEALRLLGLSHKHEYTEHFYDFLPACQPDGSMSKARFGQLLIHAFEMGYEQFEWQFLTKTKKLIPASVLMLRVQWKRGYRVLSYINDLREAKKTNAELHKQTKLLQAVGVIVEDFMNTESDGTGYAIIEQLGKLGSLLGAGRVYLHENHEVNGKQYARKLYEWPSNARRPTNANVDTIDYADIPYIREKLLAGESVNMLVSELPSKERAMMKKNFVKALLSVPVLHDKKLWGFICFENMISEQHFTDTDEKMLRSCGFLIASVIMRNRVMENYIGIQKQMAVQSDLMNAANSVATILLTEKGPKLKGVICDCLSLLGKSTNAARVSLWRNEEQNGTIYTQKHFYWAKEPRYKTGYGGKKLALFDYVPEWGQEYRAVDIDLPLHRMNANTRTLTFLQQIKSLLMLPIFLQGNFWGFLGFSMIDENRRFSEVERNILRTCGMNIASAIARNEIMEDLIVAEENATFDALTKIENRSSFYKNADVLFERHKNKQLELALLFLDIDFFKKINDQYGHDFGDEVLVSFATALKSAVRPGDLLCRHGGEEFVLLLPGTGKTGGMHVGDRIMHKVSEITFDAAPSFNFTVSIGLTNGVPEGNDDLQSYVKRADQALYQAKRTGRNKIVTT